jgi:hypothetical protein
MSNENDELVKGDVGDIDFEADSNVGGSQYPFLSPGPEGGAGCNYVLELVKARFWHQPPKNKSAKTKGPVRFAYTVRVRTSDGEGATAEGALCTLLYCQDDFGYYMRDNKNTVRAFTGQEFSKQTATELYESETHIGALAGCQVTRNPKNSKFSNYEFEGPLPRDGAEPEMDNGGGLVEDE